VPLSVLRGERPPTAVWTEQDGLLAQALTLYEGSLCSGCGHPVAETMGEENDGEWTSEEFRCHACTENLKLAEELDKSGSKHLHAMRFAARRLDPQEVTTWLKPSARSQSS
jgi:hypothetical protein